jgi:hypothetical protein
MIKSLLVQKRVWGGEWVFFEVAGAFFWMVGN